MGNSINHTVALNLKNKGNTNVSKGDIVIIDRVNADAFMVTGSQSLATSTFGVVLDQVGITTGSSGMVVIDGYCPQINLISGANVGDTFYLSSVQRKAQGHSIILPGDFGQVLNSGITPDAIIWSNPIQNIFPTFDGIRYQTGAGQLISGSVYTTVNFDTSSFDPLNRVTTGLGWHYTVVNSGYYNIESSLLYTSINWAATVFELVLYINGIGVTWLSRDDPGTTGGTTVFHNIQGSTTWFCNAGDIIDIRTKQSSGTPRNLWTDGNYNWVCITRVG